MLNQELQQTKIASRKFSQLSTETKNLLLAKIAELLNKNRQDILKANQQDLKIAKKKGLGTMLDRLLLNSERIDGIIADIKNVITLEDQIGKEIDEAIRPNGLKIKRVRTSLGVTLIVYEARPNVTIDAAVLALKSGNAVVLKGGSDAINSNRALVKIVHQALLEMNLPKEAILFIDSTDRNVLGELLKAKKFIDVVIPRGSKGLINFVVENSLVPIIETGASVVHTYVDAKADLGKALEIVLNAKMRRVSVCNALDVLLIHESQAKDFLTQLVSKLKILNLQKNLPLVKLRADEASFQIMQNLDYHFLKPAQSEDFDTEFLDYILAVKVVESLDKAIEHITEHSLNHSEAIITEDDSNAENFLNEVDAACVYHNASTAFSDGAQFGIGAEIGISTQKLHTRGPFALEGLTTYKWVIKGTGQIRD